MITFHDIAKEDTKEFNLNWPKNPHHLYRILTIWGSESGKSNYLVIS